jgi:hypothetical protein
VWSAAFVVLLVVDMRPNIQLEPVRRYPPAIYSVIPTGPESVLAEFPIGRRRGILYAYQYMYFSTSHWLRMLNGGSGYFPPSWEEFLERGSEFPSDRSLDYLRSRQVKYLVVHGGLYEDPGQFEQIRAALLARPDLEWIAAERDGGGTTELYRFR